MNNLTHCNGYAKKPLEFYWKTGISISNSIYEEIKHKKLNVYYCIRSRYKVSPGYQTNTECINIQIEHNLSSDYSLSYVDLIKQQSFHIYIQSIEQPRSGGTLCHYVIEYINEEQEILQKKCSFRVPTIKGTIEKKLMTIKPLFDDFAQKELEQFKLNGFNMPIILLGQMIANYAIKYLKKLKVNEIYDYSEYFKPLLYFYSMIADDCFLPLTNNPHRVSSYTWPFHPNYLTMYHNDNDFLLPEQLDLIHKILDFILKNRFKIEEIRKIADVQKQTWGCSEYFDYYVLKNEFLKLFNT